MSNIHSFTNAFIKAKAKEYDISETEVWNDYVALLQVGAVDQLDEVLQTRRIFEKMTDN
jgi:hypothetical protein